MEIRQTRIFEMWLGNLADQNAVKRIADRILRLQGGLMGDVAPIGEGVSEMRIHYGPGYRLYFVQQGNTITILLCGGNKKTQAKDIKLAKSMASEL